MAILNIGNLASLNPATAFLAAYWKQIIGLVLILALAFKFWSMEHKITELELKNQNLGSIIELKDTQYAELNSQFTQLNQSILDLSNDSKKYQEEMDQVNVVLERIRRNTSTIVNDITNAPEAATCEQAVQDMSNRQDAGLFDWETYTNE